MSIFNLFGSKADLSNEEQGKLNAFISEYRKCVEEDRRLGRSVEITDIKAQISLPRIQKLIDSRNETIAALEECKRAGRDIVAYRCFFYTVSVGDSDWIGNQGNRACVASDFAVLKRRDIRKYETLRDSYWSAFYEFWGTRDELGRVVFPKKIFAYPGDIFPEGDPRRIRV